MIRIVVVAAVVLASLGSECSTVPQGSAKYSLAVVSMVPVLENVCVDPAGAALVQIDRFFLDARQSTDTGADRTTSTALLRLGHIGQPSMFERLSSCIDAVDYEGIHLPLDLGVDTLVRIESPFVILGLHLAGNGALLVAGIEMSDPRRPALTGEKVLPGGFHVTAQGGDKAESGNNYAAHTNLRQYATGPARW